MRLPSGLNATLHTMPVWPVSGEPTGWPVAASHTRTVLSPLRGGDAFAVGAERHAGHEVRVALEGEPTGWPVAASHTRTVLSTLPEAMRLPSGLNATLVTALVCASLAAPTGLAGGRVPHLHRLVGTRR